MEFCSVIIFRDWKITLKTVLGIFILFTIVFILSLPVEADTQQKTAVIRASDGNVYEVQYTLPLRIENFSIHGLDGDIPSREIAAELYIAAIILNRPATVADIYSGNELGELVHEECLHTAKWKNYHEIATIIGSKSMGLLVGLVTGSIEIVKESIKVIAKVGGKAAIKVIGKEAVEYLAKEALELLADKLALQILEKMNLLVKEERVLLEACIVTQSYVERSITKKWTFEQLVSSAEKGTEVSMADIKAAYNALLQADLYVKYVHWMMDEYIVLPDRPERLWTFAKRVFPPTALGQFFASQGKNIEDLRNLQTVFAESDRYVATEVARAVTEMFSEASKSKYIWNLTSAGFFPDKPPTIEQSIEDMQLLVSVGARLFDLATIFNDPNDDPLKHSVEMTDASIADVEVIRFRPDGELLFRPFLEITPKSIGTTEVTIEARDPTGLSVKETFTVTVDPEPTPNQPPRAINRIPSQSLTIGSASPPLDVSVYFHDPDGGTIFYAAASSNRAVATIQRTGSEITILPQGIGSATITVTAANSDGVSDTQTFSVTVTATETLIERPTPQGLNVGDSIIVQNTKSGGLNVRSTPQVPNQNPDNNKIGKVYDGATGTIVNGTDRDAVGRTWWEIEWDTSDKVQWQHQPTNQRGWSVEAIGELGLLARRPSAPVPQSFDLEIQPLSVSKKTLDPGESFTLFVTIRNNGPGDSPGPALSYYHSRAQGFSATDPPQLQGTVELEPLAAGERITKSIPLDAPGTPNIYYYGAWLAANTGDTSLNNDFATEVGVTVIADAISDPVDTSDPPDLVIADISVDYDTMYPGERFTISVTVKNAGGRRAANARIRYYRSLDSTYSSDDEELPNTTDFIGPIKGGETSEAETANSDAPDAQGVYYYIARAVPVHNEVKTSNNYAAIKITVLPSAAPDLVVSLTVDPSRRIVSLTASEYLIHSKKYFRLDALVENQGKEESEETEVHFYQSSDPIPSSDDIKIETEEIKALRSADSRFYNPDEESRNGPAPELPGTYYYYACVDSVPNERNTDNNCSNVITIYVRGPDLVVHSVSVDYHSRTNTVYPEGIFDLDVTVRNQGTEDADDSTLRYYISSDPILSPDDTEVATKRVFSLDMNETSKTYKKNWIRVPYTSGFFYALVCVDGVADETDTDNNCYTPIKITVRNFRPRAEGTIPVQTLSVGTPVSVDISGYFVDPNNDSLTYTASSSDPNIAAVGVSDAQVTITSQRTGSATVTITASDGEFTATQTFSISVLGEETWMPDANLRAAVRAALGLQPNDALTQPAMAGLIILYAASNTAGTGVQDITGLEHATQLTILNLGRTGVRDLTPLQGLTQLTRLTLWYTDIWDLTPLQGLTQLTYLNLHQTNPRSIHPLQGLTQLTHLDIARSGITDITPLQGLTALTSLDLSFNNSKSFTNPGDLTPLSGLTTLTSLNLGRTSISNITALEGLTNLTNLDLSSNKISELTSLNGLTELTHLHLTSNHISDITALRTLAALTKLHLEYNQISDVSSLEALTSLQSLFLKRNSISDLSPLRRLKAKNPNMFIDIDISLPNKPPVVVNTIPPQTLTVDGGIGTVDIARYFNDPDNTELAYTAVSDNTAVATVSVRGSRVVITPVGVGTTSVTVTGSDGALTATQILSVSVSVAVSAETWMPDANLRAAVRGMLNLAPNDALTQQAMTGLTGLVASGSQISHLTGLEHATNLRWLHVEVNQISDITPLAGLTALTALDFRGNQISDITPLVGLVALRKLGLADNQIRDITPLAGLTALTELYLSDNQLSDITPLTRLTALQKLGLVNNQISDITPLARLTALLQLWLNRNQISDVSPLEGLTSLLFLNLEYNPIADVAPLRSLKEKNPNLIIDIDIETEGSDLHVDSVRVNRTTVFPGGTFRLDAVVKNRGEADASGTIVRYYQSTDETISKTDTELNTGTLRLIPVDGLKEPWSQLTAPDTPGVYYYGVCVDEVAGESDTTNNCSTGVALTVLGPDLLISSVSINKNTVLPGEKFQLSAMVKNRSKVDVSTVTVSYYQSADDAISDTDTQRSTTTLARMAGQAKAEPSIELTAPDTPGVYYYGVCVDGVAGETDTTNNCSIAVALTVENAGSVDLVIASIDANKTTVKPGENFQISAVIGNQGEIAATSTVLRYYFSTDEDITTADTEVHTATLPIIAADATRQQLRQFTAPATPGTYYYGVCVDTIAGESDTANNCSIGVAVTVGGADLRIDGTPQISKTTVAPGETFQINTRVWNAGSATSDATTLRYYLSTDDTISIEDIEVDNERVVTLSGKGAHASRRRADISKTFTAPDTPGDYYYGVCVDIVAGDADTSNNCSEAVAITVEVPPPEPVVAQTTGEAQATDPAEIQGPDLVFSMTRVDASTIKPGQGVRLHITIENQGTSAAPATMIRYYRSTDATISAEDTELRAVPVGQLGSGKSQTTWGLLPSPFSVGVYYYGACVDGVDSEFDTSNNCSDAIEVTVEARGTGKATLVPTGTISTQELEVSGSPVVLNVSGYFFGEVETWTASSNKTEVVTVSISESEVTLTPVGEGWATVTVQANSGDLAAKQTFSVSVGGAAVPEPPVVTPEPEVEGPDTSPEVSIPDANLRAKVRSNLGLEADDPLTQQKMQKLTMLSTGEGAEVKNITGLEHATQLTLLGISKSQISDITPLANLTTLTRLYLQANQISDITPLQNLTALTVLSISSNPISDITPLQNLTALTNLYLQANQISDITPLQNLTALTLLISDDNQISDITPLANLTNLTRLQLDKNQISDITPLRNLTTLTELRIHTNQISDITPLQNLTALTNLELSNNQISDITHLQNLTALTNLSLSGTQLKDITPLQNLTSLTELSLQNSQVKDITPLQNLTSLTFINLRYNQIIDVTPLEGLTSLSGLLLDGNPIEDLAPLRRLKAANPSVSIDIDINADVQEAPSAPVLPAETALLSNYPNPFNPETWIPYQLATDADVTLTLYDVRGVMVRRLVLGHRPAGFYYSRGRAAHWDGRNEIGEKVASGLYFYTFTAGDFTATQKLLIRK